MRTTKNSGFTLIELMIAVAIVAIVAALGYPSYLNYVKRTNRSAVEQYMLNLANQEDQYLLQARQYQYGTAPQGTTGPLSLSMPSNASANYTITVGTLTAGGNDYLITAQPIPGSSMDGTGTLKLDSTGNKTGDWTGN